ncbi:hypothetical protein VP01_309g1 [Puccinia sorghi]|uniref:Uncharacterized protein n=1 Tax=Puccinia sorghi TaxID=27349 RepID=A0A0L6V0A8_9BASI|nr:hypothetical protein VP01_309g1 [Puccinia sorghi]
MDIHTQLNSSYSVFTGDDSSFSCDALSFQPQLDRAKDSTLTYSFSRIKLEIVRFSYFFIFDHRLKNHPKYLKNQIKLEVSCALKALGPIAVLSLPLFLAEVRGHSKFGG